MTQKAKDRLCGAIFLVIGTLMWVLSANFITVSGSDALGETFIPYLCSGAVVIFSLALLLTPAKKGASEEKPTASESRKGDYIRVFSFLAATIVCVMLMDFIGFLPAAILLILANLFLQGGKIPKWWYPVVLGICLAIYALFVFVIGISLP